MQGPQGERVSQSRTSVDPWRAQVVSPHVWKKCANQAGALHEPLRGEAGGFFVSCEALGGCRAYLKPTKRCGTGDQVRAGREKIVSDLANDLGVLVPPILLYDRSSDPSLGSDEPRVCLSRVVYPKQWAWRQVKALVVASDAEEAATAIVMSVLPKDAGRALALNAWVGQPDHNDHPTNILFGYPTGATAEGRFIFLDYAWALGYHADDARFGWRDDRWKVEELPPFPPHMLRFLDREEVKSTVTQIESMEDSAIKEVVERVPTEFLPDEQRRMILAGLLGRRSLVRRIVSKYLP